MKKLVHKPQQILQQILRLLHEEASLDVPRNNIHLEPTLMYEHHNGPMLPGFCGASQYRRVQTNKFTLTVSTGNNCVLLDECIPAMVRNILNTDKGIVLICTKFDSVQDKFAYSLPSSTSAKN